MIISKNGEVSIKGSETRILTDLTMAIRAVYEALSGTDGEEIAKGMIDKCVELAVTPEEVIHKEAKKAESEISKELIDLLETDGEILNDFIEFLKDRVSKDA